MSGWGGGSNSRFADVLFREGSLKCTVADMRGVGVKNREKIADDLFCSLLFFAVCQKVAGFW